MLRADEFTVVHHDDTVSRFTDVVYTIGRDQIRVISATGDERTFPRHEVLMTQVVSTRPRSEAPAPAPAQARAAHVCDQPPAAAARKPASIAA